MDHQLNTVLKSVSRSFYLSLMLLPKRTGRVMGLGFLLCKIADTIADSLLLPNAEKKNLLEKFLRLLEKFPAPITEIEEFSVALGNLPVDPHSREKTIFSALPASAKHFASLPQTERSLIQNVAGAVVKGMLMDMELLGTEAAELKAFPNMSHLEKYISLIGGEPGRFWASLTLYAAKKIERDDGSFVTSGVRFGEGLQLINILRDLPQDVKNGRCYIPEDILSAHGIGLNDLAAPEKKDALSALIHKLISETLQRLEWGLVHLKALPKSHFQLRLAAWWPLAIGMLTLQKLSLSKNMWAEKIPLKTTRAQVYLIMFNSMFLVWSNRFLQKTFQNMKMDVLDALSGRVTTE